MIVTAFKKGRNQRGELCQKRTCETQCRLSFQPQQQRNCVAPGLHVDSEQGMIYGPNGENTDDTDETGERVDITRSSFYMQYHGKDKTAAGETLQCNTLSGSLQNTCIAQGESQRCLKNGHRKKGKSPHDSSSSFSETISATDNSRCSMPIPV